MQKALFKRKERKADIVYTPKWCALDMINWYSPSGTILDPCRGGGVFYDNLPETKYWCEIRDGKDFFDWTKRVDWIISNPPYSNFKEWLNHSFSVADEVVYVIPVSKAFSAYGIVEDIRRFGGVKHIRYYGTGTRVNFPMGNTVGAVHFSKKYTGAINVSFYP